MKCFRFTSCLVVVFTLAGCTLSPNRNASGAQRSLGSTKASPTPPKKMISGDFSETKAMELLFGNYGIHKEYDFEGKKKSAKWNLSKEQWDKFRFAQGAYQAKDSTVYSGAVVTKQYTEGGHDRLILTMKTVPAEWNCHGCAVDVGAATFTKVDGGWELDAENRCIDQMGSNGKALEFKLTKIGPDRFGIMFNAGWMGQGLTSESATIAVDFNGEIHKAIALDYSGDFDNGGLFGQKPWHYSTKIEFEPGSNPDYFDLKISTVGTKGDENGKVHRVDSIKRYSFNQGVYSLMK